MKRILVVVAVVLALPGSGAAASTAATSTAPLVLPARQVTTDVRPGRVYNQPHLEVDPLDHHGDGAVPKASLSLPGTRVRGRWSGLSYWTWV